jgi:hypothetical protein
MSANLATWEQDAKLFGTLETNAKPYLAMLCARSVQPSKRGQVGRGRSENSDLKTTAARFAKVAGISDKTITAYIRVWDAMAKDEVVPGRSDLAPGVDTELPDAATWRKFYRLVNPPKAQDAKATDTEATVTTLAVPKVELDQRDLSPRVSDVAAKLILALSAVRPMKTSVAKYDQARALAEELASLVGAPVAEARKLQPTG